MIQFRPILQTVAPLPLVCLAATAAISAAAALPAMAAGSGRPRVNAAAPAFTLRDQHGKLHSLKTELRGNHRVVLAFYPKDFSPGCTQELRQLTRTDPVLRRLNVRLLAISTQGQSSHAGFARQCGADFPVLADPGGRISKKYGVYNSATRTARRSYFVIRSDGAISQVDVRVDPSRAGIELMDLLNPMPAINISPVPPPPAPAPTTTHSSGQKYPGWACDAPMHVLEGNLKYQDCKVGDGPAAKAGAAVTVNYTGYLLNGTKFDSSLDHGQPFSFPLGGGQVIQGWDRGVAGMKVGGKRKLIIPPDLGYGPSGTPGGPIPPNATLVFDVEMVKIGP